LRGHEFRVRIAEERIERNPALDHADDQPVLGRDVEQVVGRQKAAAARHVLRHDGRLARDVAAQVCGEGAGVEVVPAAHIRRHDQPERLAAIEVLGSRRHHQGGQGSSDQQLPEHTHSPSAATLTRAADGTKRSMGLQVRRAGWAPSRMSQAMWEEFQP
jgi:hypothetical protein